MEMQKALEIAKESGFETVSPMDPQKLKFLDVVRDMCAVNKCGHYSIRRQAYCRRFRGAVRAFLTETVRSAGGFNIIGSYLIHYRCAMIYLHLLPLF
jgi:hypothetical protein